MVFFFSSKIIISILIFSIFITPAFAQEQIIVDEIKPCFLQNNSTYQMLKSCGLDKDFLTFAFMGFEWVTGGHFTIIITSVFILFTYLKYQNASYPILVGLIMLPITYNFFPTEFISFAFIMTSIVLTILAWQIFVRQTKEYP